MKPKHTTTSLSFVNVQELYVKAFLESAVVTRATCGSNQNISHPLWLPVGFLRHLFLLYIIFL